MTVTAGSHTVPFTLRANLIVVDVAVDGLDKRFVVDTGASGTVLGRELARELGLVERQRFRGRGAGGDIDVGLVRVGSMRVGKAGAFELTCMVFDLRDLRERIGEAVDGILGFDFLSRFDVTIAYGDRTLTFVPRGPAASAPVAARTEGAVLFHEAAGVRVERPDEGWEFVTDTPLPQIPVILQQRAGSGKVTLQLQTLHGLTLDDLLPALEESLPMRVADFVKRDQRRRLWRGEDEAVIDFTGVDEGRLRRFRIHLRKPGETLRTVTFDADLEEFDELEPAFRRILERILFTDPAPGPL